MPAGFAETAGLPAGTFYHQPLGEFILPYETVRQTPDPAATLLAFLRATYAAGATLAHWDRVALERPGSGPAAARLR